MAMVCPQCSGAFEQRLQCPQCGVRLVYQVSRQRRGAALADHLESWQQTPWGRLFVGLLLSQGLYYVLRHLFTAGFLVVREDTAGSIWATLTGLLVLQVLQAVGVVAGGLLAGAGQRRGLLFGAIVGTANGALLVVAQYLMGNASIGNASTAIDLCGEPTLQVAFGALGGLAGSLIWKPPTLLNLPVAERNPLPALVSARKSILPFVGPVAWTRVVAGLAMAVGGVVWADVIREAVLEASEGKLKINTHLQAELVTWEISALAMLAGSALAGATTKNGLKQGLCVGTGLGIVLLGIRMATTNWTLSLLLLTMASALSLGLAGGWFGSELLPPVYIPPRRRKRRRVWLF